MSLANSSARLGTDPTDAELVILRAWRDAGSARQAAKMLGLSVSGVESMLANVRSRAGVSRTYEAVFRYIGIEG